MDNLKRAYKQRLVEFNRFKKKAKEQTLFLLMQLIFETGCNVSEVSKIRIKDISKDILTIPAENTKNNAKRQISLSTPFSKIIQKRIQESGQKKDDCLFCTRQSKSISPRRIEQMLASHSKECEIKFTPRNIRDLFLLKQQIQTSSQEELTKKTGLKHYKKIKAAPKKIVVSKKSSPRDALILKIMQETGCKTSEVARLRIGDMKEGTIHIGNRSTLISSALYEDFLKFIGDDKKKSIDDFLFSTTKGHISERRIQQIFKEFKVKGSQDNVLLPKQLRSDYVKTLAVDLVSKDEVEELLGVQRVDRFTHGITLGGVGHER